MPQEKTVPSRTHRTSWFSWQYDSEYECEYSVFKTEAVDCQPRFQIFSLRGLV